MYARMINTKRINDSIGHYIHESNKHQNYWNIYMFVFVLLLGPSMVENGFSIMKNFKKRILKSFTCQLTDVIRPCNVRAIEDLKKERNSNKKNWKQKLEIDEIAEVTETKSCWILHKTLELDIENYSIGAEEKSDFLTSSQTKIFLPLSL